MTDFGGLSFSMITRRPTVSANDPGRFLFLLNAGKLEAGL